VYQLLETFKYSCQSLINNSQVVQHCSKPSPEFEVVYCSDEVYLSPQHFCMDSLSLFTKPRKVGHEVGSTHYTERCLKFSAVFQ